MKQFLISVFCCLSFYGVISNRLALAGDRLTASYYYGYVNVFSPDGSKPLGKTVSLVKRIINQKEKRIIEAVLQPSRNPNQKPKDIVTTLTRKEDTNEFLVEDDAKSFSGKMIFEGSGWNLNKWKYDIDLVDGSKIQGVGDLDSYGIKTTKKFVDGKGVLSVLIKEDLKTIDLAEFDKRHKELIGN